MQITHVDIYRYSIPMEPFSIAVGTMHSAPNVLIRIHSDEGICGVGECSPFPAITGETQASCCAIAKDFAAFWKGKDPLRIAERVGELHAMVAANSTIKSAFDMALHDLAAKEAGQPLYKFLGGEKRPVETDITIGIDTPKKMAHRARTFQEDGANIIKVKLGTSPAEDIRRIKAIRKVIDPTITLRVDANQGWSFEEARTVLHAIRDMNIEFCEQPMRSWDDGYLPALRTETGVKIMADESCYHHYDARNLIQNDACDYINIKLAKSGGLHGAGQIHAVASEAGMPCMVGVMLESRLALSANLHFVYASPGIRFCDMDSCLLGHLEDPVVHGVEFHGYTLDIPDRPGIGADVDEQFLNQCDHYTV